MKSTLILLLFIIFQTISFAQNSLKITGGYVVQTSGNLVLKNTKLDNQANLTVSYGTINLIEDSGDDQGLGGTGTTVIQNVDLDLNSKSVLLTGDVTVNGQVIFTKGKFDLNGNDLTLGTANGEIIGENSSNYFTGSSGGEITKTVVLNAPSAESPGDMGVTITSSQNLGSTTIKMGHVAQSIKGTSSIQRYYEISPTNNSGLNATVRFDYLDSELNGTTESLLAPFRLINSNWTKFVVSTSSTSANWVKSTNVDSFGKWTLGSNAIVLPIELLYFHAEVLEDETVSMIWETAVEINNDYFSIQKSANGIDFETIEEIPGAGNSISPHYYETIDKQPFTGTNYYRLKQTDFDGAFTYSEMRTVSFEDDNLGLSVFPNPMNDILNIKVKKLEEAVQLKLIDNFGRIVLEKTVAGNSSLNLSHLAHGIYWMVIPLERGLFYEKIVIH